MRSNPTRRAIETLSLVLFIFFILACRCNSDLLSFGKKRATPYPTPSSSPYTSPTATPLTAYSTPQPNNNRSNSTGSSSNRPSAGTYSGSGLNTTLNQHGDFMVRLDSIDEKGTIKGYFQASNGLQGSGPLMGGVDANGKMGLFGKTDDGQGLIISANSSGDTIRGTYVVGNKQNGVQKGEFTVTRR